MISRSPRIFAREITVASKNLFPAQVEALLEDAARREKARVLTEQTQRAGIAPTSETIVDGRRGAPIEAATDKSLIIIEYEYLREIAAWLLDTLERGAVRGPTGVYARSFILLVDGTQAEVGAITHETKSIVVANTRPYARRLEVGKTRSGAPFVVDDSRYRYVDSVAKAAKARYGNFALIRHTFVTLNGAYRLRRAQGKRRDRQSGSEISYPGIRVSKL